ncbi:endoglucanase [Caldanaerobius fijiensis DSM 17918]|uniref:Endoglucanase n=1 Tax=Caldanaerobius fijiensis DSM 17918 TaxID=1121256 RepID=A0A1M5A0W8_9THEO|nr:M42 family metallopeptidase [Caldanaerobius fijiensis]SHF23939.1 endoglucanase [Caldanaerobius fijiensis DSM 17918]
MELLKSLTSIYGPSGREDKIAEFIMETIKPYVDEISKDALGNVIAVKKGSGQKKLMLTAHMDQIGVMVTFIDDDGYLRFTNIGGLNPYSLLFKRVVFKNGVEGIISKEQKAEIKELALKDLYIDIGANCKDEAKKKVNIGDFGVFKSDFQDLGQRLISAAFDDRVGCYVLIEAAKRIKNINCDVYFVFTVQEEVGLRGARTSAYSIEPDAAIAIDVTGTGDIPNCNRMAVKLGDGVAIKIMDRGFIVHPKIKEFLTSVAEKNNIKYQYEILEMGTTDAAEIHVSKTGVPSGVISVPSRYVHSHSEMVDKNDVEAAINLLVHAIEEF